MTNQDTTSIDELLTNTKNPDPRAPKPEQGEK